MLQQLPDASQAPDPLRNQAQFMHTLITGTAVRFLLEVAVCGHHNQSGLQACSPNLRSVGMPAFCFSCCSICASRARWELQGASLLAAGVSTSATFSATCSSRHSQ